MIKPRIEAKDSKSIVFEAWTIRFRKEFYHFDGPFCCLGLPFWQFSVETGLDRTVEPGSKEQSAALARAYNARLGTHKRDLTYRIRKLELFAQSEIRSLVNCRKSNSSGSWKVVAMTETLEDRAESIRYRRGASTSKIGTSEKLYHWWAHFPYRHRWVNLELLLQGTPTQEGEGDYGFTTDPWGHVHEDGTDTTSQDDASTVSL